MPNPAPSRCLLPLSSEPHMRRQSGFTMVELMVGLALSLVIAFATSAIYIQTKQMFRLQSAQSQLEEQGRYAMTLFQHMLGQSGYRNVNLPIAGQNLATAYPAAGVFGAGDTLHETSGTLYTRFTGDPDGNILRCDDSTDSKYPSLLGTTTQTFALYVSANNLICSYDATTSGTTMVSPRTQVGRVMSYSFTYGIDTSSPADSIPDLQNTNTNPRIFGSAVTSAQWAKVYAVQVCLVIASDTDGVTAAKQSYLPCPSSVLGATVLPDKTTATDYRLYRRFVTTIYLRNRLDFS